MKSRKLRIGILLDSFQIPAWIYRSIERVINSNSAEFSLIVIQQDAKVKNENDKIEKDKKTIVYRIFNKIDERLFLKTDNALEITNVQKLLSGIPILKVKPIRKGSVNEFESADIDEISKYGLDLFIKIGFDNLSGGILAVSKYGIWTYQFTGNLHGFWEVMKNQPETKGNLLALDKDGNCSSLIYSSSSSTYPFSPARNRNRSLWKSSSFLPRQIALLHLLGLKKFIVVTEEHPEYKDHDNQKGSEIPPSNLPCLWLITKLLIRNIQEMLSRLFHQDAWFLMFSMQPIGSLPFKDFKKIVPPGDRFWADPMVIQKENRYYIFIEEFVSKKKKAHISFFEMDQFGTCSTPVKVVETDYHLSYPCVFEWNNRYYMVPESAENRTIDLYECVEFPYKWEFKMHLMENIRAVDTTLLFYHGKWWLFTGITENEGSFPEVELFLFFSEDIFTRDWKSHPLNPIISDVKNARPAGRLFTRNGKLYRPSQDCSITYGYGFDLNEILVLSENEYHEESVVAVRPDWDRKISATHTYGTDGQFQIIDAYTIRRKIPLVPSR
jgi:hypothetical protein